MLKVDQVQLKNLDYDVLFYGNCPKRVFIPIWYLPVQIKVPK